MAATSGSLGEEDEAHDRLPGSAFDSESYAVGLSRVGEWGFLGGSVSRLKADYGLPGGHGHAEDGDGFTRVDYVLVASALCEKIAAQV